MKIQAVSAVRRPSSFAMARSLALRAKLACGAGDLTEDEVKEKEAAVRVLSEMLQAPAGEMPEDLRDSILEFINDDEVFEAPCVAPSLRRVNDVFLRHKAYDCCLQHFQDSAHFKTRRLNLLTLLAVKTPGLRSKHVKLLQGRLNDDPVDCLQGLRHLRRLLKVGLPKEDVQQVFKSSFRLLRSPLKGSRYLKSTAAQLCADTTASFLQPRKRKDRVHEALFPTSKRRKLERQGVVTVEGIQPFLATPSSNAGEWMALSSFALEVCRLHADQAPEEMQEGLSMKLFHEIHVWLLRSFKEILSQRKSQSAATEIWPLAPQEQQGFEGPFPPLDTLQRRSQTAAAYGPVSGRQSHSQRSCLSCRGEGKTQRLKIQRDRTLKNHGRIQVP
eukprot:s163_g42.t2